MLLLDDISTSPLPFVSLPTILPSSSWSNTIHRYPLLRWCTLYPKYPITENMKSKTTTATPAASPFDNVTVFPPIEILTFPSLYVSHGLESNISLSLSSPVYHASITDAPSSLHFVNRLSHSLLVHFVLTPASNRLNSFLSDGESAQPHVQS